MSRQETPPGCGGQPQDHPDSLLVPRWLWCVAVGALAAGAALGLSTASIWPLRMVRALFFASAFSYVLVSLLDFREHFLLETAATGRWWSWVVVPPGESANHVATVLVLIALLVLARPLHAPFAARDWYVLVAPGMFLALGWRDELVYHRRRARHREDIMHTVAHLAVGVMLTTFIVMRLVDWRV